MPLLVVMVAFRGRRRGDATFTNPNAERSNRRNPQMAALLLPTKIELCILYCINDDSGAINPGAIAACVET